MSAVWKTKMGLRAPEATNTRWPSLMEPTASEAQNDWHRLTTRLIKACQDSCLVRS